MHQQFKTHPYSNAAFAWLNRRSRCHMYPCTSGSWTALPCHTTRSKIPTCPRVPTHRACLQWVLYRREMMSDTNKQKKREKKAEHPKTHPLSRTACASLPRCTSHTCRRHTCASASVVRCHRCLSTNQTSPSHSTCWPCLGKGERWSANEAMMSRTATARDCLLVGVSVRVVYQKDPVIVIRAALCLRDCHGGATCHGWALWGP